MQIAFLKCKSSYYRSHSLFSCLEEVRQVAVVGFLQILKNFRFYTPSLGSSQSQTSISSQATVDVHHSQTSNSNR